MSDTIDRTPGESRQRVLTGPRQKIDIAYVYLSVLLVAGVLVQVYLAGVGAFGVNSLKIAKATSFDAHRNFGAVLDVTALVLLILALAARQSRRTLISALVLAILMVPVQSALGTLGESNSWAGGLHAFDGMLILLLSVVIAVSGWQRVRAR
jgi:hypothetical protein